MTSRTTDCQSTDDSFEAFAGKIVLIKPKGSEESYFPTSVSDLPQVATLAQPQKAIATSF